METPEEKALAALETRLGVVFTDRQLLRQALTHRSTGKNWPDGLPFHNQRLEFLGDAALGLVVAELLYREFPKENEGDLSKRLVVPVGHLFFMGDNRDDSVDSRFQSSLGFVPIENLVGRAEMIFFSFSPDVRFWQFWRWPEAFDNSRWFKVL